MEERSGLARGLAAVGVRHVVLSTSERLAAPARGLPARRATVRRDPEWPLARSLALLVVPLVIVALRPRAPARRVGLAVHEP